MFPDECIILAGGLGTRLREAVPELPKCMAPVAGHPFIFHVINYLQLQGIKKFTFSLGYRHEVIEEYLAADFPELDVKTVLEDKPLGTGGAIQLACRAVSGEEVFIVNGDTLFKASLNMMAAYHQRVHATCTIALKPMNDFDRYGVVQVDGNGFISAFQEKKHYASGLINGGIYLIKVPAFLELGFPEVFSFEKDYLEKFFYRQRITGIIQDEYFIDIGIPEDFQRANRELAGEI